MSEAQVEGLGTARALFDAGNTEGAKRILGGMLEKNPDNLGAADLMVDILMKENSAKKAIEYCDNWLSRHPNAVRMHVNRFNALAKLDRKREMASSLQRFRQNFPEHHDAINVMEMLLDAKKGKTNRFRKKLEEEFGHDQSPEMTKIKGLALHNLDDVFEADHYLSEALEYFPNDPELLEAMATNRFQLGRLASARAFASRALTVDPTKRRMAYLSRLTWLFYYPGFYLLLLIMTTGQIMWMRFNKIVALVGYVILFRIMSGAFNFFVYPFAILAGVSSSHRAIMVVYVIVIGSYLIAIVDRYYNKLFGRKKAVKLRKY